MIHFWALSEFGNALLLVHPAGRCQGVKVSYERDWENR
jgi:hypothetical protein